MRNLQIDWDMYWFPICLFCAMVVALFIANFAAERAFKPRPDIRRRFYSLSGSLTIAYIATVILARWIGALHACYFFPLLFLLVLIRPWNASKQSASSVDGNIDRN